MVAFGLGLCVVLAPVSRFLAIVVSVRHLFYSFVVWTHMELKQACITVYTVVARVGFSGLSKRHLASSAFFTLVTLCPCFPIVTCTASCHER
jgi:hypothetical protein